MLKLSYTTNIQNTKVLVSSQMLLLDLLVEPKKRPGRRFGLYSDDDDNGGRTVSVETLSFESVELFAVPRRQRRK